MVARVQLGLIGMVNNAEVTQREKCLPTPDNDDSAAITDSHSSEDGEGIYKPHDAFNVRATVRSHKSIKMKDKDPLLTS